MTQHEASTDERIAALEARIAEMECLLDATQDLTEECRQHECDYYRHYLGGGPAEITHTAYHAAVGRYAEVMLEIERWYDAGYQGWCPLERDAERIRRRLRA